MLKNKILSLLTMLLLSNVIFSQLQWTMIDSPTTETLNDIVMVNESTAYAVGTNGIILKSVDGGRTFDIQNSREGFNLNAIFAIDDQNVWVVGENSLIYRTTDGGTTWNWENTAFLSTLLDVFFIDDNKGFLLYDDLEDEDRLKVVFTEDGGVTWNAANLPADIDLPTGPVEVTSYQHRATLDFPTPDIGYLCFTQGLLKSIDGGKNWSFQVVESQENYGLTGSFPVGLDFIDEHNGIVAAPFQEAIGYTTDGANSLAITDENHQFGGYAVKYLSAEDAYVVGDLDYAIYHLTNQGASVETQFFVSNPQPNVDTTRCFYGVDFWSPTLGITVGGNGNIARFSEVVSATEELSDFTLHLHPNPVQDQLSIEVSGNTENEIETVHLYNHLGQVVWSPVISSLSSRLLDVSHLNPGVYYLSMQSKYGKIVNRKIIKL